MRGFLKVLGVLVLALVAFVGFMYLASEWGEEVVELHTRDGEGREYTTHLWIVEDEGALWMRAGQGDSGWVERLRATIEAELERDGQRVRVRAVFVPEMRARVNELMAKRYGWVDRVISVTRDPARTLAIRLEPAPS